MPKRKPPRSQRRGRARPAPAPPPQPITPLPALEPIGAPTAVSAAPATAAGPATASGPAMRERSISRFTVRDYSYVRRELVRIAILAIGVFVVIVVLSFFLP